MRDFPQSFKQAKNSPTIDSPFIWLLEVDKEGWYRLKYRNLSSSFHEGATLSCSGETAKILFIEPSSSTTGSLIISPLTRSDGVFPEGASMTDNKGGGAYVAERLDTNVSDGMTFYFCQNTEAITIGEVTYNPLPFAFGDMRMGEDNMPTVDITVSNADRIVEAWVRKGNGFIGSLVRIKVIWAGDLI